jgi:hypothetical protein
MSIRGASNVTHAQPVEVTERAVKQRSGTIPTDRRKKLIPCVPKSKRRNCYLVLATEYFIKWTEVYVVLNQNASTVAEVLVFDRQETHFQLQTFLSQWSIGCFLIAFYSEAFKCCNKMEVLLMTSSLVILNV